MFSILVTSACVILCYIVWNLLKKVESYEETISEYEEYILQFQKYYTQIREAIEFSDIKLKQVDSRGSFKSDDEIGYFFQTVQDLQTLLNSFDHTKPEIRPEELPKEQAKIK